MAKGVAKIEQGTATVFTLIGSNNRSLCAAAFSNGMAARGTARFNFRPVLFQPGKKIRSVDQPVFGNLRVACHKFTFAQGIKNAGISQHQFRLVKYANQVFAVWRIDAGLAANGGVHL